MDVFFNCREIEPRSDSPSYIKLLLLLPSISLFVKELGVITEINRISYYDQILVKIKSELQVIKSARSDDFYYYAMGCTMRVNTVKGSQYQKRMPGSLSLPPCLLGIFTR